MKYIFCFLTIFLISLNAYNQEVKSIELNNWINNNPNELIPIRIEFNQNIDCYELNQQFKKNKTSIDNRSKIVNRLLMAQAASSQKQVINFLKNNPSTANNFHSFYIVNIIVALVDLPTLKNLYEFPNINSIALENNQFLAHDKFTIETNKSPNGIENGLVSNKCSSDVGSWLYRKRNNGLQLRYRCVANSSCF